MNIPAHHKLADEAVAKSSPQHVAIIMDGNGRWAKAHSLPRVEGHRQGAKAVRKAIKGAIECGVAFLTIYAFSTENWNRSDDEVSDLMGLLRYYLKNEIKSLHKEGIRLTILGDRRRLADDIQSMIDSAEALTAGNDRLTLSIALNYGSRDEMVHAVQRISQKVKDGRVEVEDISMDMVSDHLYTRSMPDPDLVIRTSGEKRISNFLLWQLAYSELMFLDVYWPDFTEQHMHQAVNDFLSRDRRFGGRPEDSDA